MKLKELIESVLNYIEFPDYDPQEGITIDLLIKIRIFLFRKSGKWYYEKFPEAYRYDTGDTRNKNGAYYSNDGLSYYVNEKMNFTSCELYQEKKKCEFSESCPRFTYHLYKPKKKEYYEYYYMNEIDHFFTHSIYLYLIGKDSVDGRNFQEPGIKSVFMKIPVQTDQ